MRSRVGPALVGIGVVLAGCADVGPPRPPASLPSTASAPAAPQRIELPCLATIRGCVALNPDVTSTTLARTICTPGYTQSVRPSSTYTNGVKAKLLREAGIEASQAARYQLDHVIPLALGGHPRKLSNLQLHPWGGEDSATDKDALERRLQRMVCNGQMALAEAQRCIGENWQACAGTLGAFQNVPPSDRTPVSKSMEAAPRGPPECQIKGNIGASGRIYHLPGSPSYQSVAIDAAKGERWFCTEQEAIAAGWRPPAR